MAAGLQRAEFPDPSAATDEVELELSLGLAIGGGKKKRKAEIDFLNGSFSVAGSAREGIRNPDPIPVMPMYVPIPRRSLPPPSPPLAVSPSPNPISNIDGNPSPNPNHRQNGGKRSVRMKRTPSYPGSPVSCYSTGPIRGGSSSSEARSQSDPHCKRSKQAIQEAASNTTAQAAAAAEKADRMPCVMTMGRNGEAVNGILYRYSEREVSIVCVCHGASFSPEGFVRHAGGAESSHPLRQIVVVPS